MIEMPDTLVLESNRTFERQEGFQLGRAYFVKVSELSEQEALIYAEEMKQEFLDHWRRSKNTH